MPAGGDHDVIGREHPPARCAAASPPLPPPITTRSNFSLIAPRPPTIATRHPMVSEDAAPEAATMAAHSTAVNLTRRERMHNPLLDGQPLPPFLEIRPEHVEPAVREVLTENRARIEELATLTLPTFATLIEPLEDLQHRVARTWSPVSHLNAVQNSDAPRSGYNACLPLLSAHPPHPAPH